MGYVPGYEYDVFVSYSSADNEPAAEGALGWVARLLSLVEMRLIQKVGRAAKIFFDQDGMKGNESLREQLVIKARQSATLLIIVSPNYVQSKWCARERDAFMEGSGGRPGSRVFPVHFEPLDDQLRAGLPAEFQELRGYRFWKQAGGGGHEPIGIFDVGREERQYFDLVNDVVCQLTEELKRLRTVPAVGSAPPARETVYVAECTDDLAPKRAEVCRYLEQAGIRALPETWYPRAPDAFAEAARRDMESSRLFVQLLSEVPGARGPDIPHGYNTAQLELARKLGLPIMQWRSPDLKLASVTDADALALLKLETVRAENIEDFKRALQRRLTEPTPSARKQDRRKFVFVDSETADESLAKQVRELIGRYAVDYAEPIRNADPAEIRQDIESNLQACDMVLLLYGATSAAWVRRRLLECRKILAVRERPFEVVAVVEGPPPEKDPLNFMLSGMKTVDARKGLNEADLGQLLAS